MNDAAPAAPVQSPRQSQRATVESWDIVFEALNYDGLARPFLMPHEQLEGRLRCDGFGELADAPRTLLWQDMVYDWSHVRDSSPNAIAKAAEYLIQVLAVRGKIVEVFNGIVEKKAARLAALRLSRQTSTPKGKALREVVAVADMVSDGTAACPSVRAVELEFDGLVEVVSQDKNGVVWVRPTEQGRRAVAMIVDDEAVK